MNALPEPGLAAAPAPAASSFGASPAVLPHRPLGGLEVVSIAKSYDKRAVLSDISLAVGKGEIGLGQRVHRAWSSRIVGCHSTRAPAGKPCHVASGRIYA